MNSTESGPSKAKQRHFYELDSLRGVAAATVVLHHFLYIVPTPLRTFVNDSPLRIFFDGHQAVMLFFALSGFVLTLPSMRRSALNYPAFLIKRLCRIYLPYLAALALSIACDLLTPRLVSDNPWINGTWSQPVSVRLILQHVLFLGVYDSSQLNTAFWSLIYEMRISLVFPFIAFFVLRVRFMISLLAAIMLWGTSLLFAHYLPGALGLSRFSVADLSLTLFYAAIFVLGSTLAKDLARVETWFRSLHRRTVTVFALVAGVLYGYVSPNRPVRGIPSSTFDAVVAVGALGLIILAVHSGPMQRFLTRPLIHHLGKVSYSLYLVHGTVLFVLIHTMMGRVPLALLLVFYLVLTTAATELFYRFVERPTMSLGRRLTSPRVPGRERSGPAVLT